MSQGGDAGSIKHITYLNECPHVEILQNTLMHYRHSAPLEMLPEWVETNKSH